MGAFKRVHRNSISLQSSNNKKLWERVDSADLYGKCFQCFEPKRNCLTVFFIGSFGFVTFSNEWEANKAKNSSDEERTLEGR